MADAVDVDAAGRDVGRDQGADLAGAELGEHALALALRLVAVDRLGGDAGLVEAAHDLVGAVLGAGEDERALDGLAAQQVGQHRGLAGAVDMDDALRHPLDRRGGRRDGDLHRIAQHLPREVGDLLRHGGGEEQRLPLGRKLRHDLADVMDEAHVEHPVGLVEHQEADMAEAQRVALHEIEQASGGRDQHVDAVHQRAHLASHRDAADRERVVDAEMASIGVEAVQDLAGKLARGRQHQDAAGLAFRPLRLGGELVQDRQREGRGLAGAGLRDPDDVAPAERGRNGLGLDRGGGDVFLLRKRAQDRLCEAEFTEGVQNSSLSVWRDGRDASMAHRRISRVIKSIPRGWVAGRRYG